MFEFCVARIRRLFVQCGLQNTAARIPDRRMRGAPMTSALMCEIGRLRIFRRWARRETGEVSGKSGALNGELPRFEGDDGFESALADSNEWERSDLGQAPLAASRPRPTGIGWDSAELQGIYSAYLELLDQKRNEQAYQSFIETNTRLVPRQFVLNHGIWCDLVFWMLPLGSDYVCDFAVLTKSSVQWRLVLVEIERPDKEFFRGSTLDLHRDFTAAIEQVSNWRSFLSDGLAGFVRQTLGSLTTFPQIEDSGDVPFGSRLRTP